MEGPGGVNEGCVHGWGTGGGVRGVGYRIGGVGGAWVQGLVVREWGPGGVVPWLARRRVSQLVYYKIAASLL